MNENIFSQSNSSTFNFDNSISTTNLILTTLKSDDSVPPHYEQQQQQKQHQQCDEDQKSLSPTLTTSTTTAIPSIMVNKKGEMSSYSDFSQIHMDRGNCSDNSSSNESVDINIPKEMTSSSPLSLSSSFSLTGEYKDYSTITAATTSINTVNLTNDKCSDTNDQFDKPLLNFINHTINNTGLGKTEKTVNQEMSTQDTFSSLKSIPGKNLFPGIINHNIDSINKSEVEHTEHLGGFIQNQTTWNALSMAYSSLIASGLYGLNNKSTSTVNHSTNTPIDKFQSLLQCHSIPSLLKQRSLLPTCESLSSGITSTTISSSSTIPPLPSSLFLSNSLGRIHSGDLSHQFISPANETVTSNNNNNNKNFATPKVHQENSANEFNLPAIMNNLLVENLEGWRQLQKTGLPSNIDPQMLTFYAGACCPVELSNTNRRKNATRETTSMLKTWLNEHRKNPYPTKGEKIMLALITKMSLTQVSTWFANARRRLKKENKVTWNLRTDCSSDVEHDDEHSVEDGDGDDDNDFVDNSTVTSKATTTTVDNQNRLSNEHDLQTITGLQGLKHYLISKHSENYEKFSMSSNKLLFNKEGCTNLITEGNKNKISRLRNFPNPCDQIDTIPKKRINLDYNNSSISSLPTPTSEKSKTRKIWSLVDMVDEKTNHSNVESINEKNPLDLQNTSCDNWLTQGNKNLQSQHFLKLLLNYPLINLMLVV
uniref:Homeobox domain-containing protein n=1 Tax=Trichobilharzia regenti TaxID=157069 RepID=A0AA85J1T9_TRIRE|nr:unnamed protein product [Trichobilharzia regenti]